MLRKGRFVSPFSDIGFNKLFGRVNKSEEFLIDLINDVFEGEDNKAESWGLYSPQGKTWDRPGKFVEVTRLSVDVINQLK